MFPIDRGRPRLRVGLTRQSCIRAKTPESISNSFVRPSATKPPVPSRASLPGSSSLKQKHYFSVLYVKRSKKKRKSWLDGYVILTNDRHIQLQNENGKSVSTERFSKSLGGLKSGNTLEISSWEVEIQSEVAEDDYTTGRIFTPSSAPNVNLNRAKQRPFKPLRPHGDSSKTITGKLVLPMYDPSAEDAVVLLPAHKQNSRPTIPIVLDPFLTRRMRPHQHDGLRFLFECCVGSTTRNGESQEGAILADEMGLGKSLQAIALIWTLIKQGPFGTPLAKKTIIVCPASLVRNWVNEVKKWLGDERLKPVTLESGLSTYESKEELAAFVNGSVRRLLIISYEMFRTNAGQLYGAQCGLVICDEGHRLKSAIGNKTIDALRGLRCGRRVILTGTPIQNDLEEFFAVCDFVNPGCLGSLTSFRSVFATPIIASRDSNATPNVKFLGEARADELSRVTSKFVLRRTAQLLEKYLPPKYETAIFCRLQSKQEKYYELEAQRHYVDVVSTQGLSAALCAINYLRKICNHPVLFSGTTRNDENGRISGNEDEDECFNTNLSNFRIRDSIKLHVTASLCEACSTERNRLVVVSNFTSVLNLIEEMLRRKEISFCRLDGNTSTQHRVGIVRRFNEGILGNVFLLSSKAGGVGLNLIGANRLLLYDPDWNPATDMQAMARVWRDGQKKPVFVYRLLCTGTIEEKIFQRQLFKGELQCALRGDEGSELHGSKEGNFKAEDLKDLFQYKGQLQYCETLEVLARPTKDEKRANFFHKFDAYRCSIESEGILKAEKLWCRNDNALRCALIDDPDTRGSISYLYTKKYGIPEKENASNEPSAVKKRTLSATLMESDGNLLSERYESCKTKLQRIIPNSDEVQENNANSTANDEKEVVKEDQVTGECLASRITWDDALKHLDNNSDVGL